MPNTTNSVWVAPAEMNLPFTNADGSIINSGWNNATFNGADLAMNGSYGYANRSYSFSENANIPVTAGHLYALELTYVTGDALPPVMGVRISFRNAGGSGLYGPIRRVSVGAGQGTVSKAVVHFHVPDDGSAEFVRFGFNKFIGQLDGARGTSYLRNIKMVDFGRDFDAGNLWMPSPPAAITPFNSGNNEITISETGAWALNGLPYIVKAAFPDWNNDPRASFENSRDNGFNTCYHVNPVLHRSLVPAGMNVIADFTGYLDPSNALFGNTSYIQGVNDMIADFGDRWIGVYIDTENNVWDSYQSLQTVVDNIRARLTSLGEHQRPIMCHCQNMGGAEWVNDIVDYFEFKANPHDADFGAQDGDPNSYDSIQGQVAYVAQKHPRVNLPFSSAGYNTPHTGSNFVNQVVAAMAMGGGGGYSLWSDRPNLTYHGHGRGYEQQPWWSDISTDLANMDSVYPALLAPATNTYQATMSGTQDGALGVVRTLRAVGTEVWGIFASKSNSASSVTIDTPDDISAFSDVWTKDGSVTQVSGSRIRVDMDPQGLSVFRFTPGVAAVADIDLGADVFDVTTDDFTVTAAITGSTAAPTFTVLLNGSPAPAADFVVSGDTVVITPSVRPSAYTVNAEIVEAGTTYPDSMIIGFAAQSSNPLYSTSPNITVGFEDGSTGSIAVSSMAVNGVMPYVLSGIELQTLAGDPITGATVEVIDDRLVVTQGTLAPGSYRINSTLCDSSTDVEPPPVDPEVTITAPVAGTVIAINQAFNVNLLGTDDWRLILGTSPGLSDLYDSGLISHTVQSVTATGLPDNGVNVYATAITTGDTDTAQYIADNSGSGGGGGTSIRITSPVGGDALPVSQEFIVDCRNGDSWTVTAGTSLFDNSYFQSTVHDCSDTSVVGTGWPQDGSDVYVSVYELDSALVVSQSTNYVFTTQQAGTGPAPDGYVATPTNLSDIGVGETFIVNYQDTDRFTAMFGTTPQSNDLFSVDQPITGNQTGQQSITLNSVPPAGDTVYLSMTWYNGTQEMVKYYSYTVESSGGGGGVSLATAWIDDPINGGNFRNPDNMKVTLNDTASWTLVVGTSFGAQDLLSTGGTTSPLTPHVINVPVNGAPDDGSTVYATLIATDVNGNELLKNYSYQTLQGSGGPGDYIASPSDTVQPNPVMSTFPNPNTVRVGPSNIYDGFVPNEIVKFTNAGGGSQLNIQGKTNYSGIPAVVMFVRVNSPSATGTLQENATLVGGFYEANINLFGDSYSPGDTLYIEMLVIGPNLQPIDSATFVVDGVGMTTAEYNAL